MTFRRNFQRNTSTTGRVVDTGPTTRTNTGLTGLGAVGGPRGVGAGALRVLVEFLTTYDSEALGRLESDLANLDKTQGGLNRAQREAVRQRAASAGVLTRIANLEQTLTKGQNKLLRETIDLEKRRQQQLSVARRSPAGSAEKSDALRQAQEAAAQIRVNTQLLRQSTGLVSRDVALLLNREENIGRAKAGQIAATQKLSKIEQVQLAQAQQRLVVEQQVARERSRASVVTSKLGSLALGAIGGLAGGALVGVGFAAVQGIIDQIGEGIRDIVDPANKAREAVKSFSDEIKGIAQSDVLSFLDATKQKLAEFENLGLTLDEEILSQAAALEQVMSQIRELSGLREVERNEAKLQAQAERLLSDEILKENEGLRLLINLRQLVQLPFLNDFGAIEAKTMATARIQLAIATEKQAQADLLAARAARELANAQAAAATFAAARVDIISGILNQRRDDIVESFGGGGGGGSSGPSARTKALQAQIDSIQDATAAAQLEEQLGEIATKEANLLLEERLALLGEVVDVEQYAGEQRIIAIQHNIELLRELTSAEQARVEVLDEELKTLGKIDDATSRQEDRVLEAIEREIEALEQLDKAQDDLDSARLASFDDQLEALDKQAEALDLVNDLLDLQYKSNQKITRNQDESIGDFLARRAQENRNILVDFERLRIRTAKDEIQSERDVAEEAIDAENERREAIIDRMDEQRKALQQSHSIRREERRLAIETIQEQRDLLQNRINTTKQANDLAIEAYQQQASRIQSELQLIELSEQRKRLLADQTKQALIAGLQAELQASQEADSAAAASRSAGLQKQKDATKQAYDEMVAMLNPRNQAEFRNAVLHADSMADLALLTGRRNAIQRLIGELEALLDSGIIGPARVAIGRELAGLRNLNAVYGNQQAELQGHRSQFNPGMQHGGVFELFNSRNIFGNDIRTGEAGPELGVVLSNKVVQALHENRSGRNAQFGDINLYGSQDPLRDEFRLKRAVRQVLREELH